MLPDVVEEESDRNDISKDYRPRSSSTGLKGLFSFKRSRNKSGDSNKDNSKALSTSPANGEYSPEKSNKGFKSLFRPRSQSDAAAARNAMIRRRHISQGSSPMGPSVIEMNGNSSNNNFEPLPPRGRSTSWGAKERLAMSKQLKISTGGSAGSSNSVTPMSQLIAGSGVPINRKVEKVSMVFDLHI